MDLNIKLSQEDIDLLNIIGDPEEVASELLKNELEHHDTAVSVNRGFFGRKSPSEGQGGN